MSLASREWPQSAAKTDDLLQEPRHILALDGLRGAAVVTVIVSHFYEPLPAHNMLTRVIERLCLSGWMGVDLFFVLSGFLITGILLRARTATNYFRVFYARRALRLFPVYYLALALMFWVLIPASHNPHFLRGFFTHINLGAAPLSEQAWYWINVSNLHTAFYPSRLPFLTVFWTLAVEEQFYLIWPACVRWLGARTLLFTCLACTISISLLRNLPAAQHENDLYNNFIYRMTPFHMDGLFCGAALAICFSKNWRWAAITKSSKVVFPIGVALLAILSWSPSVETFWRTRLTFSVTAITFSALLWLCIVPGGYRGLSQVFRNTLLRRLGRYSYFMYVFHVWVLAYVQQILQHRALWLVHHGATFMVARAAISFLVLYALSALSWDYLEGPALRLKKYARYIENKTSVSSVERVN